MKEIKLEISLCNSYQYIDQLAEQIKKLLFHEIGHYIYYTKDGSTNTFETICRDAKKKIKKNTCTSDGFVSSYAQKNSEEDYAETFSRWAITQPSEENNVHSSAEDETTLSKKFSYFDTLLSNFQ